MPKQHIVLIMPLSTYEWGTENCGGVDSVCQMFGEYLVSQVNPEFKYTIIGLDPQSKTPYTGEVISLAEHVDFIWLPCSSKHTGFKIPGIVWQNWHIRKLLKKLKPDLVHTHFWSSLLGCGHNGRSVVTIHSYKKIGRHSFGFLNNLLYEKIIPLLTKSLGDKKIVVGKILKDALLKDGIESEIIYNPIDESFFYASKKPPRSSNNSLQFITCSLINPKKNIEQAIFLIAKLKNSGFHCHLNIVGGVSNALYSQKLINTVEEQGLCSEISFLGKKNKRELVELYSHADCGIFTSKEETFGLVPLEIIASGLPLLCTEVGILSEKKSFFESLGILYLSENTTVDQINKCINEHDSEFSVDVLKNEFNLSEIIKKYHFLYNQLLEKK
ncbi:VpsD family glycosyltransferase [Pseudoalteromonas sp. S558]|uniref:VpsD family glycosyltransferase n=1 Tax=Pseudoalteromonas sp. S558 TaxID=2066515 RepID=UPI00110A4EBA|nr:VpsD family glycosyltransferase [Pseudoalteromonas sp. S558]TMO09582.1 exopolysaccharide biosynthesis protein [Pseudoalteromonas sp. S558]